jgi:hypothetical protein
MPATVWLPERNEAKPTFLRSLVPSSRTWGRTEETAMSHLHTRESSEAGIATGMILGIVIALLVVVLAGFLVLGGFGGDAGDSATPGGTTGTLDGSNAPSSMHYIVPQHQVLVR